MDNSGSCIFNFYIVDPQPTHEERNGKKGKKFEICMSEINSGTSFSDFYDDKWFFFSWSHLGKCEVLLELF